MYVQAINRGFVVMTEAFDYVVEAVFVSDIVYLFFKEDVATFAAPREILLSDVVSLSLWIKQRVIEMRSDEIKVALSI